MSIVNTLALESNRQIKINFDGGDLSSDAGLLLIKEFISKLGIDTLLEKAFKTNDPVFKSVLEKDALASQPTVSRFFNRMDEDTLNQFLAITRVLRMRIYSIQMPQAVILDLDSTLLDAYGRQEGRAFNFHYQSNGYHPLVCYDGMTGDLIKIQLRDGTQYSYTGVVDFLQPVLGEYLHDYPEIPILLRGDSGFSTPDLYKQCEENGTSYVIRLKDNGKQYQPIAESVGKQIAQSRQIQRITAYQNENERRQTGQQFPCPSITHKKIKRKKQGNETGNIQHIPPAELTERFCKKRRKQATRKQLIQ